MSQTSKKDQWIESSTDTKTNVVIDPAEVSSPEMVKVRKELIELCWGGGATLPMSENLIQRLLYKQAFLCDEEREKRERSLKPIIYPNTPTEVDLDE